jgi:predicted DNA binding CopG/RHH family protein
MSETPKVIDPIPSEFASYEEAAEFWDTHDTTDYLDDFETVAVESELRERRFEVGIDMDLLQVLHQQAKQEGVGIGEFVNTLLREQLKRVA